MKNKDERMKIMTEVLNGIKVSSGVQTPEKLLHLSPLCTVPEAVHPNNPTASELLSGLGSLGWPSLSP